jgi:predicted O-linked N-acetylglucosamine transferase (SPINDLY family)
MSSNQSQLSDNEIITILMHKIQKNPNEIHNYYQLGNLLKSMGRFEDAKKCYIRILQKIPNDTDILFDMAFACQHLGQESEAFEWYAKLFEIDPLHVQAHINMGHIYRIQGNISQACNHFKLADSQLNHSGLEILGHLSLPIIYQSRDEILFYRKRLTKNITTCRAHLDNPFKQIGITQFLLAYHNLDDTLIQKAIADFYYRSCPNLNYRSSQLNKTKSDDRISIGFATTYFLDSHPVGKVYQGLIKYLNRQKFRVILFDPAGTKRPQSSKLHRTYKDEMRYLPRDLFQCQEIIARENLDILFYPEIGMDPFIYFLAFSRLARIQCVGWGHPVTSGIRNLDYYISTTDMEPDNAMKHYTENLVMLKSFITCFSRIHIARHMKRSDFDIPEGHWYVCPQNIQKLHPDMDRLFSQILLNDPKGWLILFSGKYPALTKQLQARMTRYMPKLMNRIIFFNSMAFDIFLQFLSICDAVLDIPFFSSGTTTLEAISVGVPIVTLPGQFFRNRLAYGCFKRMNVLDTVAHNENQYISLANRLACDRDFRMYVSQLIMAKNEVLFDNQEVIRAYEQFFFHISQ